MADTGSRHACGPHLPQLPSMAPLPAPEPSQLIETIAALDARKLRFELNRMALPKGLALYGAARGVFRLAAGMGMGTATARTEPSP